MTDEVEEAKRRNNAAKERAEADPEAVASAAVSSEIVSEALRAWLIPLRDKRDSVEGRRLADKQVVITNDEEQALRLATTLPTYATGPLDTSPGLATAGRYLQAKTICEHLSRLARGPEATDGLALLTLVVEEMPHEITPEPRKDRRIFPVVRSGALIPERQRGMLFGGLLEGRDPSPELPLFEAVPIRKSVAILDLADAAGVPIMARGQGAPLPARLFVRAGLAVQPGDRKRQSIRMAITVRQLRDGLYPNGWRIGKHWSDLKAALIGARDYTIRLPDGGLWFMLALRKLPSEDKHGKPRLDDHVVLDMAFPPNSSDGPVIDLPTLDALSVKSAPRWRAYIAAHALTWEPGKTRRRHPETRRFIWSRNPADYPILTFDDRRRLAFGETDRKNRTREDVDAPWRDLPGLMTIEQAYDQRTGEAGWRIMPHEAAPDEGGE